MTYCKCCGKPEDQFEDEQLDEEWPDGTTQRAVNQDRAQNGQLPYCSIPCMKEKLGV